MSDTPKKIIVNGKEVEPCKKGKVPSSFDWQAVVKVKQAELDKPSEP
jgi:hypothetical protein